MHAHTANKTVETINHLDFEVLEHPAYSPDLALPTTMYLDRSKMLHEVLDFLQTMMCGKRCINGCASNRKHSSWREYASLWTAGSSASKRKETM